MIRTNPCRKDRYKYIQIKLQPISAAIPVTSNKVISYSLTGNVSNNALALRNYSIPLEENHTDMRALKKFGPFRIPNPDVLYLQVVKPPLPPPLVQSLLAKLYTDKVLGPIFIIIIMAVTAILPSFFEKINLKPKYMKFFNWKLPRDTILQTDATVITGVLILLTITSVAVRGPIFPILPAVGTPVPFAALTAEVIFPFAASAIVTAARHSTNNKNKKKPPEGRNGGAGDDKENTEDEILGTRFMISGFVYLIAAVIFLLVVISG
jgi:hypothetical protein